MNLFLLITKQLFKRVVSDLDHDGIIFVALINPTVSLTPEIILTEQSDLDIKDQTSEVSSLKQSYPLVEDTRGNSYSFLTRCLSCP